MPNPLLYITDGDTIINLIGRNTGFLIEDWTPSIAPLKSGGVYQQSVVAEGRQLVMTNYDNAIETFSIKVRSQNQDSVIRDSQELLRLLNKARSYWTVKFETQPVWLVARAPNETNTRYAIIHNYQQSGLDNPYSMPFFACDPSTMDDITLVVERGHWAAQIPGNPDCVEISSYSDAALKTTEAVGAGTDDAYVSNKTSSIAATLDFLGVGTDGVSDPTDTRDLGVRFSAVDIDDDAEIVQVFLQLIIYHGNSMVFPCTEGDIEFRLYGEDADNAATFSTYANFTGRSRTSEYVQFFPQEIYIPGEGIRLDITDLFNAVRDRGGWTDGNAMVFFLEAYNTPQCNFDLEFSSFEDNAYDDPQLLIDYQVIKGETTPSCENKYYVTDKFNTAALSHIYTDDGGVWSANLVDSTAIDIFPAVPAVNDAIYFGCGGPFTNIVFYLAVAQEDVTIEWEYYQDTVGWSTIPTSHRIGTTAGLTQLGYISFTFAPPYDTVNGLWVPRDVSSDGGPAVNAYWMRIRVTAIGGAPVRPETSTIAVYTVTWPNINIADDEIIGDIEAVATAVFGSDGIRAAGGKLLRDRLIVALQSERGPYAGTTYAFNPYLPFSSIQLPSLIESISGVSGNASYVTDITAPSGQAILYSPSADSESIDIYHTVDSSHYFGKYRVFMRVRKWNSNSDVFLIRVTTEHSGVEYASTNELRADIVGTTTDPKWKLLDLGELNIPTGLPARTAEENESLEIHTHITFTGTATYEDLYLCDLILMPADEWIADIQDFGSGNWGLDGKALYVDSTLVPKADVRGLVRSIGSSFKNPVPMKTIAGKMVLPANKSSKLWILTAKHESDDWISDPGILTKISVHKEERYLGLRGNR